MPSFCDEEGRCEALEEAEYVDANDCSFCEINHIVKAFNRGIEFQKEKSPWIRVEDDLPCNHEEFMESKHSTKSVLAVLAMDKDPTMRHIEICSMCDMFNSINMGWHWCNSGYYHVVYWKPLPKMPD